MCKKKTNKKTEIDLSIKQRIKEREREEMAIKSSKTHVYYYYQAVFINTIEYQYYPLKNVGC